MTKEDETKPISPYDVYGTNDDLESGKGVEVEYPFGTFIINRAGGANKAFGRVFQAKCKPHRRQMDNDTLDDDIKLRILAETYAETVIIGWKGVHGKDGKKLSFNKKNCVQLLIDLPDFFIDLQKTATEFQTFISEQEEIEEKN